MFNNNNIVSCRVSIRSNLRDLAKIENYHMLYITASQLIE